MFRRVTRTLTALADGNTGWFDASGCPWVTLYAKCPAGKTVTAGVVTLQTGSFMTGNQSTIDTEPGITTAVTLTLTGASNGGVVYALFPIAAYDRLRAVVTTPVTGTVALSELELIFVAAGP